MVDAVVLDGQNSSSPFWRKIRTSLDNSGLLRTASTVEVLGGSGGGGGGGGGGGTSSLLLLLRLLVVFLSYGCCFFCCCCCLLKGRSFDNTSTD